MGDFAREVPAKPSTALLDVEDIISKLTLDEKISLLSGIFNPFSHCGGIT